MHDEGPVADVLEGPRTVSVSHQSTGLGTGKNLVCGLQTSAHPETSYAFGSDRIFRLQCLTLRYCLLLAIGCKIWSCLLFAYIMNSQLSPFLAMKKCQMESLIGKGWPYPIICRISAIDLQPLSQLFTSLCRHVNASLSYGAENRTVFLCKATPVNLSDKNTREFGQDRTWSPACYVTLSC